MKLRSARVQVNGFISSKLGDSRKKGNKKISSLDQYSCLAAWFRPWIMR